MIKKAGKSVYEILINYIFILHFMKKKKMKWYLPLQKLLPWRYGDVVVTTALLSN